MPDGLVPIEPPASRPNAARAYAVSHNGQVIGAVFLVHAARPHGNSSRRDWWAVRTLPERYEHPRPFDTASNAAQAIRYQYDLATRTPRPDPIDVTLQSVQDARSENGTAAALWLAASIIRHHITELEANRTANPPALWRELRRISAWLEAATHGGPNASEQDRAVPYRRTFDQPELGD